MTANEFSGLLIGYMKERFNNSKVTWSIETTKWKNPKAKPGDEDYNSAYTMYVLDSSTKKILMKSREYRNGHKSSWSDVAYGRFLATLEEIKE